MTNCRGQCGCFLVLLALQACAGLEQQYRQDFDAFDSSEVTLTLVQEIGPGRMFRLRNGSFGSGTQTYMPGYTTAVAARGNDLFIVDRSIGQLMHVNLLTGEARSLLTLTDANTKGLHVDEDLTVLVVDSFQRAVLHLTERGQTIAVYRHSEYAPAPVDVTLADWGRAVIVADALQDRFVTFNRYGGVVAVRSAEPGYEPFAGSVGALASSGQSVFVLDDELGEVTRFSLSGQALASYGEDELLMPTALAVDQCGRLFVADQNPGSIFVSVSDMMVSGRRTSLGMLPIDEITDLWSDGDTLYIATGAGGVLVMHVEPGCPIS